MAGNLAFMPHVGPVQLPVRVPPPAVAAAGQVVLADVGDAAEYALSVTGGLPAPLNVALHA